MTTTILEKRTGTRIRLCPLSAMADEIDTRTDRKLLVINNPCFEVTYTGTNSDKDGKKAIYTRKECRGYDTSCPAHPDHR